VKVSLHDFRESASKERRAMVVKSELGLDKLMGCQSRVGTRHSEMLDDLSLVESCREGEIGGGLPRESEMYLWEMTSPGLQTPAASPRESMFPDSPREFASALSSSSNETSNETLEIDPELYNVVKGEVEWSFDCAETSSVSSLRTVKLESEDGDGIPRYWVSELEQTLSKAPCEIAPGVFAV
jgi:hypothetical protein